MCNFLWLLFELTACSSAFWVAETNTSVINVMAIWCMIDIIWFQTVWNFCEYLWIFFSHILSHRLREMKHSLTLRRANWTVPYLTDYLLMSVAHIKTAILLQLVALCGCSLQHSWSCQCLPPTVLLVQQLGSLWFVVEMKDWTGNLLDWLVGVVIFVDLTIVSVVQAV
jgi:hypothetical protein